jgi:PadR family transcriptional regulator PadR
MAMQKKTTKKDKDEQDAVIRKQVHQLNVDLKRGLLPYVIIFFLKIRPHYSLELQRKMARVGEGLFNIQQNIVYQHLKKFDQKGIVASYPEKSTIGAKRKYYYLTPLGERLFEEVVTTMLYPTMSIFSNIVEARLDDFGIQQKMLKKELSRLQKMILNEIEN